MARGDWARIKATLEAQGYKLEPITLTKWHTQVIYTAAVAVDTEGTPIYIQPPAGQLFVMPGLEDVDRNEEAGQLYVKFADSSNNEISDESAIRMYIQTASLRQTPGPGGSYGQFNRLAINEIHRPSRTIVVVGPNMFIVRCTPRTYAISTTYVECSFTGYYGTPAPKVGEVVM